MALVLGAATGCGGRAARPSGATRQAIARADAALARRDYPAALAGYRAAVAGAPDPASRRLALRELADAQLLIGEDAGAAATLTTLGGEAPSARTFHDLGLVRAQLGQPAAAERALRRARALAPRDPRPRIALGALLVRARRWDAALIEYRGLADLELPPRLRAAVSRAIALVEAERAASR